MFTGLVESLGKISAAAIDGTGGIDLTIEFPEANDLALGESVAVNGCCLTVVEICNGQLRFQVGPETLARTNLGRLVVSDRVNLERALRFGDRLGGHLMTGHVDAVGTIAERTVSGDWQTVWFTGPPELVRLLVPKGCVAVDGVSLTIVDVTKNSFSVMLIPHTLAATTLGLKRIDDEVNLEADLIGKYVAQCVMPYR